MCDFHYSLQLRRLNPIALLLVWLSIGCTLSLNGNTSLLLPHTSAFELLLDIRAFPKNWEIHPCNPERCQRQAQAMRHFIPAEYIPGHVIQETFRFGSIEAAQAKYKTYYDTEFRERLPPNKAFVPPLEVTYQSPIADEYHLGCGVDVVAACGATFRYGNYFVYFYFSIDDGTGNGGMKIQEVEPVLRAMDERAAKLLKKSSPKR